MSLAPFDGVAKPEASGALQEKRACFPTLDGDKFAEHSYTGAFHEFQSLTCWVMEGECDRRGLFVGGEEFVWVKKPAWCGEGEAANEYWVSTELIIEHFG